MHRQFFSFHVIKYFNYLIALLLVSCGTKYNIDENPKPVPINLPCHPIRVAVVLGGGGARGVAHVGVLAEFEEAGIPIDAIVGCSAGSIVGALYADCPDAAKVRRLIQPVKTWDILDISLVYCRYGLVQGRSLRNFLWYNLSCERYDELKIPLYVVATDLLSGELITFSSGPIIPTIHASSCVPFIFAPVLLNGRLLVDGGVADPIPVGVAKEIGAEIAIAIDLSELLPPTCPTNLFGVATRSAEIKFLLQSQSCADGADIIIKPDLGEVGMFDDKYHAAMYEAGRKAAREAIPKIRALMQEKGFCNCSE